MSFTDEDLVRWKTWWEIKAPGSSCDCMDYQTMQALLARLEAAESILENGIAMTHSEDCDKIEHFDLACTCNSGKLWEAWRKSCGK